MCENFLYLIVEVRIEPRLKSVCQSGALNVIEAAEICRLELQNNVFICNLCQILYWIPLNRD